MRKDYISWDTYFMGIAYLSGLRSKDPSTQVGACIVNNAHRIIGIGYNGFPHGCEDEIFPWKKEGDFTDSKYAYVVHAELNAILNSSNQLNGCTIYVTHFPCNECAKSIVQSGIKHVVYASDKLAHNEHAHVSKRIFSAAGISIRKMSELTVNVEEI